MPRDDEVVAGTIERIRNADALLVGRGAGQILDEIVLADADRGDRAHDIATRRAAWMYILGDDEKERSRGLFTES